MSESPHNPCATCGACCTSYIVPVCGYDIWLLSSRQRLSPEQYLVACPQEEPGQDGFRLEAGGTSYGLALDKQGRFDPNRPCVFLMHLGDGNTRCGVYHERPVVCRAYPMSIWAGKMSFLEKALCPPNSWPQREAERPGWRLAVQHLYMQHDIYHEVVARWNARIDISAIGNRHSLQEYFSYVLNVYEKLERLAAELGPDSMERVRDSWQTAPRSEIDEDELLIRGADSLWLNYLLKARQIIDAFYAHIPSQPILALMPSNLRAAASDVDGLRKAKKSSVTPMKSASH